MAVPATIQERSLRLGRLELSRLGWAFAISLAVHLLCFGTYELGKKTGIWEKLPKWLRDASALTALLRHPAQPPVPQQPPLMFVDVNPQQASPEPPKNAAFYSDKNSVAANPDADKDTGVPKIGGKQTDMAKAETVKPDFNKLQPSPPPPQPAEQARPKPPPGDLVMAKPEATLRPDTGKAEETRPRTIQEALARQHKSGLPGEQMKQEGGVKRLRIEPGFDAKATPFGAYDAAFISAVTQHWYDLLDKINYSGYRAGKVVLQFHLNYDGRITDMQVLDNNVGNMLGLLCQEAVSDPAPFEKWPREMRLMVDKDYREIQFTFYYY